MCLYVFCSFSSVKAYFINYLCVLKLKSKSTQESTQQLCSKQSTPQFTPNTSTQLNTQHLLRNLYILSSSKLQKFFSDALGNHLSNFARQLSSPHYGTGMLAVDSPLKEYGSPLRRLQIIFFAVACLVRYHELMYINCLLFTFSLFVCVCVCVCLCVFGHPIVYTHSVMKSFTV